MEEYKDIKPLLEKYLNDDITSTEQARIDKWLENDSLLYQWLGGEIDSCSPFVGTNVRQRLENNLIANDSIITDADSKEAQSDKAAKAEDSNSVSNNNNRGWKWGFAASIAILISVCGIFLFNILDNENKYEEFIVDTQSGERSMATLPDGTTVRLNHLSEISYHYDKGSGLRILNLRGEAAFDVETDPEHPFIINCDGLKIECHGTSFNVKGYPDEDEVTVVLRDGAITASTSRQAVKMKPGTKVQYDKRSKHLQSSMVDVIDYDGWSKGNERFDNVSFDDILKAMSRRYGVRITILTPSLYDVRLSGSIGGKSLDETLHILSAASGSKYLMESDSIVSFYK